MIIPHFASAKILNASGWDDVIESGQLNLWTVRQKSITAELLHHALVDITQNPHITVAAIQALLSFEVSTCLHKHDIKSDIFYVYLPLAKINQLLVGNEQSFSKLDAFYRGLISKYHTNTDIWGFLMQCDYLITRAYHLGYPSSAKALYFTVNINELGTPYDWNEGGPFDASTHLSLFTFNLNTVEMNQAYMIEPLKDLFNVIYAATCQTTPIFDLSVYNYLELQHKKLSNIFQSQGAADPTPSGYNDPRIIPIQLCSFILTSHFHERKLPLQIDTAKHSQSLASSLRAMLNPTTAGSHMHAVWMPFPGGLAWCHAIGFFFASEKKDRTWFLMQFLRVSHFWVLDKWDESTKSIDTILSRLQDLKQGDDDARYLEVSS
jgi:hypothetical protein